MSAYTGVECHLIYIACLKQTPTRPIMLVWIQILPSVNHLAGDTVVVEVRVPLGVLVCSQCLSTLSEHLFGLQALSASAFGCKFSSS